MLTAVLTNEKISHQGFARRLVEAMLENGFATKRQAKSGVEVATLKVVAGVSQDMARRYAEGLALPSPDRMQAIANWLGVRLPWLRDGIEPKYIKLRYGDNVSIAKPALRAVPVINSVQAGNFKEVVDDYAPGAGMAAIYTDDEGLGRYAFGLIVEGPSMREEFWPGDKVIIDPDVIPNPGDFVVAKCCDKEEATFKKYRPRGTDSNGVEIFDLIALNPDYAPIHANADYPCRIVGTMTEHHKYRRLHSRIGG